MILRVDEIKTEMDSLGARLAALRAEWKEIQEACDHPRLPKRELGEEYCDHCPDCGFASYCYAL